MSIVPPLLAGAIAALVCVVMLYRHALPHHSAPTLLRLAVSDGAAMIATVALAAVLVIGSYAFAPPRGEAAAAIAPVADHAA